MNHHSNVVIGRFAAAAGLALVVGLGGCSSHKNDAGQQYARALMHGNAPQASFIWMHMTPEQRLEFQRGQDARAAASREEVKSAVEKQLSAGQGGNIEETMPDIGSGSLSNLPAYSNSASAPTSGTSEH